MLHPKKKISRKELKEDTLVTTYSSGDDVLRAAQADHQHGGHCGGPGARRHRHLRPEPCGQQREGRTPRSAPSTSYLDTGQYQMAIDGVPGAEHPGPEGDRRELRQLAGRRSRAILSRECATSQLGKYDEALEHFKNFCAAGRAAGCRRRAGHRGVLRSGEAVRRRGLGVREGGIRDATDAPCAREPEQCRAELCRGGRQGEGRRALQAPQEELSDDDIRPGG